MKQNVVDVLMYLFENIIAGESMVYPDSEHEHMFDRLEDLGFPPNEIMSAFDWLEDLAGIHSEKSDDANDELVVNTQSVRVYSALEKFILEPECISFLMHLEQNQVISPASREIILDRVTALDVELGLEQLKWIVMIVLYSQPGEETAYAWMENMVFDDNLSYMQ
jgi:Smg protein